MKSRKSSSSLSSSIWKAFGRRQQQPIQLSFIYLQILLKLNFVKPMRKWASNHLYNKHCVPRDTLGWHVHIIWDHHCFDFCCKSFPRKNFQGHWHWHNDKSMWCISLDCQKTVYIITFLMYKYKYKILNTLLRRPPETLHLNSRITAITNLDQKNIYPLFFPLRCTNCMFSNNHSKYPNHVGAPFSFGK